MFKPTKNYVLNSLCLIVLATLAGPVSAHTFAVGTTAGSSPGAVQVWFRSWHGCNAPILEGSIKIEGVNGTTFGPVVALSTLSSCDTVGGISTFPTFGDASDVGYYCEVDSSGNIVGGAMGTTASLGYDPNSPITDARFLNLGGGTGAILCSTDIQGDGSTSDKWQGSEFSGLAAGDYKITYLECDADGSTSPDASDCENGSSPSADFDINYDLIAEVDIEVSAAVIAASGASSTPVPTLPFFALLSLGGLMGLFGLRKLKR